VNRQDFGHGLYLDYDELSDNQVETIATVQRDALIVDGKGYLSFIRDFP
jgi:hypothetical protein